MDRATRLLGAASVLVLAPAVLAAGPAPRVKIIETPPLRIDRIYHSMEGPVAEVPVDASDLDWITAVRTEVVDDGSGKPMGNEFFCHSQLQLVTGTRLTVAATGGEEVRFPPGFAVPVSEIFREIPSGARELTFLGMALNNYAADIDRTARVRATVEYLRDEDLEGRPPPKRLYTTNLAMAVEDLAEYVPESGGTSSDDVTTHCALVKPGQKVHWIVPPGPQRTRRVLTNVVPTPATVHLAMAHMHNHGRYIRLTDRTTGKMLWQADVTYEPDRAQIASISTYSSVEGFRVYPDREYEIEAFYDNTTDKSVDAMAVIYLYFNPDGDRELYLIGPNR